MEVGDKIQVKSACWKFNGNMVDSFEDHIKKSVPQYLDGHARILGISDFFVKNGSVCYELGSSTGILSYKLAMHNSKKGASFYGIEIENDMVNKAKATYQIDRLKFIHDDINSYEYSKSDLIVSYYCIQFIHPALRQRLLNKIYQSLHIGGAFVFFEKIRFNDARSQDIITALYNDFKIGNGYSFEEIFSKTMSLKGILEPQTSEENFAMLRSAGFKDIYLIMRNLSFEGLLAVK